MEVHKKKIIIGLLVTNLAMLIVAILRWTFIGEIVLSYAVQFFFLSLIIGIIALFIFIVKKRKIISGVLFTYIILGFFFIFLLNNSYVTTYAKGESHNLSVLSINLYFNNRVYEDIDKFIEEYNPDVLVLIEFSSHHYENLKSLNNYNYNSENTIETGDNIIYSKYPIENSVTTFMNNYPIFVSADIEGYTFYAIHTAAPFNQEYFQLRNQYLDILASELNLNKDKKIIAIGDYNITPWSGHYRDFVEKVNLDNATLKGELVQTWKPNGLELFGAHIDHAFLSQDIEVQNSLIVPMTSSDHDGIYIEIN